MRKEIDLTKEQLRDIKILAAHDGTNAKNYIETLVAIHIEKVRSGTRNILK